VSGPFRSQQLIRHRPRTQQRRHAWIQAALPEIARRVEAEHDLVIFQVTGGPDELGRSSFLVHWWGYHPATGWGHRGQVFMADLDEHRERELAAGKFVQVWIKIVSVAEGFSGPRVETRFCRR
jgi:hypothetical protein